MDIEFFFPKYNIKEGRFWTFTLGPKKLKSLKELKKHSYETFLLT